MLRTPLRDSIDAARDYLERHLTRRGDEAPLANVMHEFCAFLCMIQGDYRAARAHLLQVMALGVPNKKDLAEHIMRVARLSETKLGDLGMALEYYEKFATEVVGHRNIYFAAQKAAQLREKLK
jgi:hypothetical protein